MVTFAAQITQIPTCPRHWTPPMPSRTTPRVVTFPGQSMAEVIPSTMSWEVKIMCTEKPKGLSVTNRSPLSGGLKSEPE